MMVGLFTWMYVLNIFIWIYLNKCCYIILTNICNDIFYVSTNSSIFIYIYIHTYMCIYMYIYVYICMNLLFYSCIHTDCYIHIHILHFLYQYLSGSVCRYIFLYISYKYLCTFIHIGINVHMLLTPLQAYMYTYVYFEKKKCIHMLLHLNITSTY